MERTGEKSKKSFSRTPVGTPSGMSTCFPVFRNSSCGPTRGTDSNTPSPHQYLVRGGFLYPEILKVIIYIITEYKTEYKCVVFYAAKLGNIASLFIIKLVTDDNYPRSSHNPRFLLIFPPGDSRILSHSHEIVPRRTRGMGGCLHFCSLDKQILAQSHHIFLLQTGIHSPSRGIF